MNLGQWYHVVAVWDEDSSANTELYIDGVDVNGTDTGTLTAIGTLVTVRAFQMGTTANGLNPFSGVLDDVRIYSRALTPTEIQRLYELGP